MADLDEIMAGRDASEPSQTPTPSQAPQEPVQAPPGQEPPPQPQDDADPVSGLRKALDEERGKRRKYKDELAAVRQELQGFQSQFAGFMQAFQAQQRPQQPPPAAPDFWENPDAALDHRLKSAVAPVQQGLAQTREEISEMMAAEKYGEEVVRAAYAEMKSRLQNDPQGTLHDYQRIMSSRHPFGTLVQWHKQQSVLKEVGDDPAAFRERVRAELMAEIQKQQPAHAPPSAGGVPQGQLPTNFATARSAGVRTAPQTNGPLPLSEIMKR